MVSSIKTLLHLRQRRHAGLKIVTFTIFMVTCIIAFISEFKSISYLVLCIEIEYQNIARGCCILFIIIIIYCLFFVAINDEQPFLKSSQLYLFTLFSSPHSIWIKSWLDASLPEGKLLLETYICEIIIKHILRRFLNRRLSI